MDLKSLTVAAPVSSDCPSNQELLRRQLASRAAGWDRPASSLRLQGPFHSSFFGYKYYSV